MQSIALEFRREGSTMLAAIGTDSVTYLDGRWGAARRAEHIHRKVEELRQLRPALRNAHFVGFSILGEGRSHDNTNPHVRMWDENPPAWVK